NRRQYAVGMLQKISTRDLASVLSKPSVVLPSGQERNLLTMPMNNATAERVLADYLDEAGYGDEELKIRRPVANPECAICIEDEDGQREVHRDVSPEVDEAFTVVLGGKEYILAEREGPRWRFSR